MGKSHTKSALDKFEVIRPHLEESIPLSKIAKNQTITLRTLKRWIKNYRENGLKGLERKENANKGKRKTINQKLVELTEALILKKPPISLAAIHRKIIKVAQHKGFAEPSYKAIWLTAKQINPALVLLAHEGSKAYEQEYDLLYRRESATSNEIWQADHTPLDIVLLDENGISRKPWLTIIIDDYSRAIAGYYISFDTPTSVHVALALRQAIWRKSNPKWQICGIPNILYSDNGSDFKSKHIRQVAIDLRIQLKNSIPDKPRGRGKVERFFLTITQLLLMNLSGYTPPRTTFPKATLTLEQFTPLFEQFLLDNYHQRVHSTTGVPPMERWIGKGFLPQQPDSLELLDLLLLTVVRPRKVRRDGIHFQNFAYIEPTLAAYVGESVTIRYDPRDLAEIRVYHNNAFVCRAICQELAGRTISLKEIIKARKRRKKELRKTITERKSLLDSILESSSTKAPLDLPKPQENKLKTPKKRKLKLYKNE